MTGLAMIPNDVVAIGIGAMCGAMARHQCGRVAAEWIASDPVRWGPLQGWHTSLINIGGSFVLGGVAATPLASSSSSSSLLPPPSSLTRVKPLPLPSPRTVGFGLSPRTKLMVGVGFCGSFTTFSTYSVDVVTWLSQGQAQKALAYVAVNNVGGIVAVAAGMLLVKKILG